MGNKGCYVIKISCSLNISKLNSLYILWILYVSTPVKGLLGNWVRLVRRIAVSNRSYDRLKNSPSRPLGLENQGLCGKRFMKLIL